MITIWFVFLSTNLTRNSFENVTKFDTFYIIDNTYIHIYNSIYNIYYYVIKYTIYYSTIYFRVLFTKNVPVTYFTFAFSSVCFHLEDIYIY